MEEKNETGEEGERMRRRRWRRGKKKVEGVTDGGTSEGFSSVAENVHQKTSWGMGMGKW